MAKLRVGTCRILAEIGSGGMAVVYKAIQEPLDRLVAIKTLKPEHANNEQLFRRFEREARIMASLHHENLIDIYDMVINQGHINMVMEYVEGIDIYDLLELNGRMPPDVAALITFSLARALEYIHQRGIIHRDIKPANVIISYSGDIKLMDFGIARDERFDDITQSGHGVGTPSYMSPEQILGNRPDVRTDLFSLGVLLYQMLTGVKPFDDDGHTSVIEKVLHDAPRSPRALNRDIPRPLESIVIRCMAKNRNERYASAQAVLDDLSEYLTHRISGDRRHFLLLYLTRVGLVTPEHVQKVLALAAQRAEEVRVAPHDLAKRHLSMQLMLTALLIAGHTGIALRWNDSAYVHAGAGTPLFKQVAPERSAQVEFISEPPSLVFIDGHYALSTPHEGTIALQPGIHKIVFEAANHEPAIELLHAKAGEERIISKKLHPGYRAATSGSARGGAVSSGGTPSGAAPATKPSRDATNERLENGASRGGKRGSGR